MPAPIAMPERIDIGQGQQVAVEDGTELTENERADLSLAADEIEEVLPLLLGKRILGFVVKGVKVALKIGRDHTGGSS